MSTGSVAPDHITMDYDEWAEKFKLKKNALVDDAPFDGCLFETYGREEAQIKELLEACPRCVWTIVEDDDGNLIVVDGWHYVNRFGYLVTELPAAENTSYEVVDEDMNELNGE